MMNKFDFWEWQGKEKKRLKNSSKAKKSYEKHFGSDKEKKKKRGQASISQKEKAQTDSGRDVKQSQAFKSKATKVSSTTVFTQKKHKFKKKLMCKIF